MTPDYYTDPPAHMERALAALARVRRKATRDSFPVPRLRRRPDYLEILPARDGSWYWHKRAGNHRIVSDGRGYGRRHDALRGARRANPGVRVKAKRA